jgi:hypothetical protein
VLWTAEGLHIEMVAVVTVRPLRASDHCQPQQATAEGAVLLD